MKIVFIMSLSFFESSWIIPALKSLDLNWKTEKSTKKFAFSPFTASLFLQIVLDKSDSVYFTAW